MQGFGGESEAWGLDSVPDGAFVKGIPSLLLPTPKVSKVTSETNPPHRLKSLFFTFPWISLDALGVRGCGVTVQPPASRLLQVVRSIRLVRFLSALRALVLSVIDTTRQLLWALILLTLVSRSKASLETRVSTVEVVSSSKLPKGENI